MLVPSIFSQNFIDNFVNDNFPSFRNYIPERPSATMHTDVKEFSDRYEMGLELPGHKKEEIQADLKDGYLTINAEHIEPNEQTGETGRYIRRERFTGKCTRTFYVGDDVQREDIKASFEDGILKVVIPKVEAKPQVEVSRSITIE